MSTTTFKDNLERKHAVLESLIGLEMTRPLPDFTKITNLKKQKLRIKEQLLNFSAAA